uniref:epididymal-specific lipocalin-9 n=1 Tax=Jaculus jaculus TaxID=51337 RepID=UPI001E1B11B9|nr:epididymal-specific lipocalin-9 [Jaculus jaculus]
MRLLLLLGLGLVLACAPRTEGKHSVVKRNFDPQKIAGKWYSILLASDRKDKIEENGSMRVFVENIHAFPNGSLGYKLHTIVDGKCAELILVSDKTGKDGEYFVEYKGHNTFRILETDYIKYAIFHLTNVNNGETFQMTKLYGREKDLSEKIKQNFVKICKKYGIAEENIVDLTKADRCLQARGQGEA